MGNVKSSKSAVSKIQSEWANKLKDIEINDLETVCTFSKGGFAEVSLVHLIDHPDSCFALKALQKNKIISKSAARHVLSELQILSKVRSDFIVQFYKALKDETHFYFLMEYLPGGELSRLAPLPENSAKFYVACVVEALGYLHAKNIVHNDIKLENVVIAADGYVKLIDFGVAKKLELGEMDYGTSGTASYLPPEVAWRRIAKSDKDYFGRDRAGDLWALRVLLHNLVTNKTLFVTGGDDKDIYRNITEGIQSVEFPHELFSQDAADFIRELCAYVPNYRLGYKDFSETRKHRWIRRFDWTKLRNKTLKPPVVPSIKSIVDTGNFQPVNKPLPNGEAGKEVNRTRVTDQRRNKTRTLGFKYLWYLLYQRLLFVKSRQRYHK